MRIYETRTLAEPFRIVRLFHISIMSIDQAVVHSGMPGIDRTIRFIDLIRHSDGWEYGK